MWLAFRIPSKWQNKSFKCIDCPYVQIIHTNGNHWITLSGIDGSMVQVCDSKYFCISEETKEQIALITAADKDYISIHLESTQFQTGSSDCGLFARAFATDLCFGNNPASYRFVVKSIYYYCQFQADLPPSLFIV